MLTKISIFQSILLTTMILCGQGYAKDETSHSNVLSFDGLKLSFDGLKAAYDIGDRPTMAILEGNWIHTGFILSAEARNYLNKQWVNPGEEFYDASGKTNLQDHSYFHVLQFKTEKNQGPSAGQEVVTILNLGMKRMNQGPYQLGSNEDGIEFLKYGYNTIPPYGEINTAGWIHFDCHNLTKIDEKGVPSHMLLCLSALQGRWGDLLQGMIEQKMPLGFFIFEKVEEN